MFFTVGLNDPHVIQLESAKMVAKLRALKSLMRAGHGGKSGRYEHLDDSGEGMVSFSG